MAKLNWQKATKRDLVNYGLSIQIVEKPKRKPIKINRTKNVWLKKVKLPKHSNKIVVKRKGSDNLLVLDPNAKDWE